MSRKFRKEIERLIRGLASVTAQCIGGVVRRGIAGCDGGVIASICVEACAPASAPSAIPAILSELLPYRCSSESLPDVKASSSVPDPAVTRPRRIIERQLGTGLDRPRKTINFARDDLESIYGRPARAPAL